MHSETEGCDVSSQRERAKVNRMRNVMGALVRLVILLAIPSIALAAIPGPTVPEPGTIALIAIGAGVGVGVRKLRGRRK